MGFLANQLFAFIKLLNSETGTNQIAAGIAAGFILGMTPFFSLQSILVFFLVFIFRIQIGAVFIATFFFAFPAFLLDPVFHRVGVMILELPSLQGLFTSLYNLPIIPFTRFYNTIVMGSGVLAFALSPLVFYVSRIFVVKYRAVVVERFKQSGIFKALKMSAIYKWYYKYNQYYG